MIPSAATSKRLSKKTSDIRHSKYGGNRERRDRRSSSRLSKSQAQIHKRNSRRNESMLDKDGKRIRPSRRSKSRMSTADSIGKPRHMSVRRLGGDSMQIKYYKRRHKMKQSFAESQRSDLITGTSYSGSDYSHTGSSFESYYSSEEYSDDVYSEEEDEDRKSRRSRSHKPTQYSTAYYSDNDSVVDTRDVARSSKSNRRKLSKLNSFASSYRSSNHKSRRKGVSRSPTKNSKIIPPELRGGYCTDSEQVITVRQKEQTRARMQENTINREGYETDAELAEQKAELKEANSQMMNSRGDLGRNVPGRNFIPQRVQQYNQWWFL